MIFLIEVFVCSSSVNANIEVETLREMSQHEYCASGTWQDLVKDYASKFKGRILTPEDQEVLEKIEKLTSKFHDKVRIYDVSRISDKMKAIKEGIRRTPTVIVQGKKYESLKEVERLLLNSE